MDGAEEGGVVLHGGATQKHNECYECASTELSWNFLQASSTLLPLGLSSQNRQTDRIWNLQVSMHLITTFTQPCHIIYNQACYNFCDRIYLYDIVIYVSML